MDNEDLENTIVELSEELARLDEEKTEQDNYIQELERKNVLQRKTLTS